MNRRRTGQPHGTDTRYAAGCRCDRCRAEHAAGARRRRRALAYGTHVPRSVPNIGIRRRVHALMTLGWSMRELSRRLGWCSDRISVMLAAHDGISPANHARIVALYDQLWDVPAPRTTAGQRITAARAVEFARRAGAAPPMAWDDDTIDNPDAKPRRGRPGDGRGHVDDVAVDKAMHGQAVELTTAERREVVRLLSERGWSATAIADRLDRTARQIVRLRKPTHSDLQGAAA